MLMKRLITVAACAVLLTSVSVESGSAWQQQGGQGRGQAGKQQQTKARPQQQQRGNSAQQARGRSDDAARGNRGAAEERARGRSDAAAVTRPGRGRLTAADVRARINELPEAVRRFDRSDRMADRIAVHAVAHGVARGLAADEVNLRVVGDHVRVRNRKGDVLLDLSDARARELGAWELRMLGDRRPTGNAPSFCRSGAGHPVWGRQWCLDKGFGLGSGNAAMLWSRGDVRDVIFNRRVDRDRLERPDLIDVLGDIVFGRLALQALTLGFTEPLVGVWVAEPNAPQLLRVQSGGVDVAELVDLDGDNRVDVLFVAQYR